MAAEFLRQHGIDLQYEMSKVQFGDAIEDSVPVDDSAHVSVQPIHNLRGVRWYNKEPSSLWDITISAGKVTAVVPHHPPKRKSSLPPETLDFRELVLAPSLCHPHIHLDKCFLLSDPKYSDLEIVKGDFSEALALTSKAKSRFTEDDLLSRGRWLIAESVAAGVTCIRAFVEVDVGVRFKCLDAGLKLKEQFKDCCEIQLCVFAQEPVWSRGNNNYPEGAALIEEALRREGVDVLGSTPYVEEDETLMRANVDWAVSTALKHRKHLDLHLDYNLDPRARLLVDYVIEVAKVRDWTKISCGKTIVLGHCNRLTLLSAEEWHSFRTRVADLPISFIGLPTSDLYMMGKPEEETSPGQRFRGTLQVPEMIQKYDLNGAIGVNNVGNAFTPQGNCDPMSLASMGVGVYQAGTKKDTELLYECVSTRAKAAIGLPCSSSSPLEEGASADFVVFGRGDDDGSDESTAARVASRRTRRTIQEVVYDPPTPRDRRTIYRGSLVCSTLVNRSSIGKNLVGDQNQAPQPIHDNQSE